MSPQVLVSTQESCVARHTSFTRKGWDAGSGLCMQLPTTPGIPSDRAKAVGHSWRGADCTRRAVPEALHLHTRAHTHAHTQCYCRVICLGGHLRGRG